MNFQELLKKQKENTIETVVAAAENESRGASYSDDNEGLWKPQVDKAGNGFAVIRFLPAPDSDIPWVKYYSHGFKGTETGKWFIEDCPTSIGKECPLCKANSALWNSGIESDKDIARQRKRRLHYVSNILVVKDTANPENNGKVFLYKYGAKIFEKLMSVLQPAFEDEKPLDPFNLLSGANFKVKIKQVGGYWNYDSSEFDVQSALYDGDEDSLKEVFEQLSPIQIYVSPERYKSFTDLQSKMNNVLGLTNEAERGGASAGVVPKPPKPQKQSAPATTSPSKSSDDDDDEDDDDMEYFRNLASGL